jgi:hypothetical protein
MDGPEKMFAILHFDLFPTAAIPDSVSFGVFSADSALISFLLYYFHYIPVSQEETYSYTGYNGKSTFKLRLRVERHASVSFIKII